MDPDGTDLPAGWPGSPNLDTGVGLLPQDQQQQQIAADALPLPVQAQPYPAATANPSPPISTLSIEFMDGTTPIPSLEGISPAPPEPSPFPPAWEDLCRNAPNLPIPSLSHLADIEDWQADMLRVLTIRGLRAFTDQPVPAAAAGNPLALSQWERGRAAACLLLHHSLAQSSTLPQLTALGYSPLENDPRAVLHGTVLRVRQATVPVAAALAAWMRLAWDPAAVTLPVHLRKLQAARKRLRLVDPDERRHVLLALESVGGLFRLDEQRWARLVEAGGVSWNRLMRELYIITEEIALAQNGGDLGS